MALVVAVGSLVEEDHEQGVAHILEHLAFNATEARFPVLLLLCCTCTMMYYLHGLQTTRHAIL